MPHNMDVFNPGQAPDPGSSSDVATNLLSQLFGSEWWKIMWGADVSPDAHAIYAILQPFNTVIMGILGLIIFYIVGHAFVGSAHDGTPLGRRLHTIWVPVRSTFTLFLLAPIPWAHGLCIIQGIVLTCVGWSIQFANFTTYNVMDYLVDHHGQLVVAPPSTVQDTAKRIFKSGFYAGAIQGHQFILQDKDDVDTPFTLTAVTRGDDLPDVGDEDSMFTGMLSGDGGKGVDYVFQFKAPEPFNDRDMGAVAVYCKRPGTLACHNKVQQTDKLLAKAMDMGWQEVMSLDNPGDYEPVSKQDIDNAINTYVTNRVDLVREEVSGQDSRVHQAVNQFADKIKQDGFAVLGSYYWTYHRLSQSVNNMINPSASISMYSQSNVADKTNEIFNSIDITLKRCSNRLKDANSFDDMRVAKLGEAGSFTNDDKNVSANESWTKLKGVINDFIKNNWLNDYVDAITSSDPVATLMSYGSMVLNLTIGGLATGLILFGFLPAVGKVATPLLLMIVPPLFMLGFVLAYYLPAVPFLLWMIALWGWFLLIIEALVAAPVWALMHASPDGEGLAGDRASEGYTLLIQLLFRPVLMVLGFFFAILLLHLLGFVGDQLKTYFASVGGSMDDGFGVISSLCMIVIASGLVIVLVHKSFSLIYWLPDSLPRWIGKAGAHLAEYGNMGEVKQITHSSVGQAAGTATSAGNRGVESGSGGGFGGSGSSSGSGATANFDADFTQGEVK